MDANMKKSSLPIKLNQVVRMTEKGTLNFEYPIQRKGGQWDDLQKSLFIHSIASNYPIPQILALKVDGEDGVYILDGKQRITNVVDFLQNKYPLHEETPKVRIENLDEEFEIAGLTFDELPDDIKNEILSSSLNSSRLENATDEEIEELFFRWNNGTPLTKQQKSRAKMGLSNATIIDNLVKHNFIADKASFTPLQRRRSDDEAVILQSMMLMSDIQFESFVADKILKFATDIRESDITDVTTAIKDALDYMNEAIEEKTQLLKKLHLPTLILIAKKAIEDGVPKALFNEWVEDFTLAIDRRASSKAKVSTMYMNYTGAGSVKKDKVLGRKKAMLSHYEKFLDKLGFVPEEGQNADVQEQNTDVQEPVVEEIFETKVGENQSIEQFVEHLEATFGETAVSVEDEGEQIKKDEPVEVK
jgi:hypothetical protein